MAFAAARMILKDKRRKTSKEDFTPRNRSKPQLAPRGRAQAPSPVGAAASSPALTDTPPSAGAAVIPASSVGAADRASGSGVVSSAAVVAAAVVVLGNLEVFFGCFAHTHFLAERSQVDGPAGVHACFLQSGSALHAAPPAPDAGGNRKKSAVHVTRSLAFVTDKRAPRSYWFVSGEKLKLP
ncbi:putative cytosol aminopeptidase [Frankliniella fusca]|uniref:Cytosol aminopeptidase n=1 Tax=Frankliniella fusca TaxID=407009 RepID=A0AAE1GTJ0_9NEOP|nr:putative cytosol aminopeptidase [Frankliniella fusca]